MAATSTAEILVRVKRNLIIDESDQRDDSLFEGLITSAVSFAEGKQNKAFGYYDTNDMAPTTLQAIVMLVSHWYESRTGGTDGFFGDSTSAAQQVAEAVDRLLEIDKEWVV